MKKMYEKWYTMAEGKIRLVYGAFGWEDDKANPTKCNRIRHLRCVQRLSVS